MRMSQLFFRTLREIPADVDMLGDQLLVRAGFIQQLDDDGYFILPLGYQVISQIEQLIREKLEGDGGQEFLIPATDLPSEDLVYDLSDKIIQSYKQLPAVLFSFREKLPNSSLKNISVESFSMGRDISEIQSCYRKQIKTFERIFSQCNLPVEWTSIQKEKGISIQDIYYLTESGDDQLIRCESCGYLANKKSAEFLKLPINDEDVLPTELIETPNIATIADLSKFLNLPSSKLAKAVFLTAVYDREDTDEEKLILAVVRGDMKLNETKLKTLLNATSLSPASEEEIVKTGAVPGYGSPVGVTNAVVVVDDLIAESVNLVGGANVEGYHKINMNFGRDFQANHVADIVTAEEGCKCKNCGGVLKEYAGIKIGEIKIFDETYWKGLESSYLDQNGKAKPIQMLSSCSDINILFSCVAEENNDQNGLVWPIAISPYDVHLISLGKVDDKANEIYESLLGSGLNVLFDDRGERAGVKFNDADLMGIPIRITIGERSLKQGKVELKLRYAEDKADCSIEDIVDRVLTIRKSMVK